ncbi:diphthamide biosynthesis protein 4 [Galendromus occidentalis]|uniref:Diphthamide biosynthesis protein 4 n=1 Tax=Galendromus occidentalis TaxID=34638 RepID=A0AAJ6QU52_9ACAR|nr:diphthamide biosynthesis protein 4 [Galendromus occidentalis]
MDKYSLLGLSRDCTEEEIRNAYKRLALKCHPDKPTGDRETFSSLEQAYKTLSEPSARASYDNELANASKLMHPVWQAVNLDDMELLDDSYRMDCRCGASLQAGKQSLVNLPALIECNDCSTMVRVDPAA